MNAAAKAVQVLLELEQTKLNPDETTDDSGSEVQEIESTNLNLDESADQFEVLDGQDAHCLHDYLEFEDEDDDEAISNSEYYVESVEDLITKETSSVAPVTELTIADMGVACINESVEDSVTKEISSVAPDTELRIPNMGVACTNEEIDTLSINC